MPLIHSKKKASIGKNIATEEKAHPEQSREQDVAIALNTFRKAGGKYPRKRKKS